MKNNELISIIVPVYNVEKYLSKCIDSIINQTYSNLEIILVDDGSSDKSSFICDNYSKKDLRIKVISKENGGLSDARNVGIDNMTGKYLSFIDSDDYIAIDMIENLYNNLKKNNSDISICNMYIENKNGKLFSEKFLDKEFLVMGNQKFDYIYNKYNFITVPAWGKLYKEKIFKDIRYPFGKVHEDEAVIFDVLSVASSISYFDKPLYYYVQRDGSITNKFNLKRLDIVDIHEERLKKLNNNKKLLKLEYKSYIQVLVKTIIPGLYSINEKEKYSEYINKEKKLSNYVINNFELTIKEKIKLNLVKHFTKIYIKICGTNY